MDYLASTQLVLSYIEDHLRDSICIDDLSNLANYSPFHLQRIFKHTTGDSIQDYVRKRRITEAAKLLISTNLNTIDIGCEFEFQSREAFSRAFKKTYGKSPSEVRRMGEIYKIRDKMSLPQLIAQYQLRLNGLDPILVHRPQRIFNGQEQSMIYDGRNMKEGPLRWLEWNTYDYWSDISPRKVKNLYTGIFIHTANVKGGYFIGTEIPNLKETNHDMDIITIPESWYLSFTTKLFDIRAAEQNHKFSEYVFCEWLPKHPEIERLVPVTLEEWHFQETDSGEEWFYEVSLPIKFPRTKIR